MKCADAFDAARIPAFAGHDGSHAASCDSLRKRLGHDAGVDPVPQRHEQGVVAADRARHLVELGLVEGEADEVGRAGRSLDDEQVAGRLDRQHPFGEDPLQPRRRPVVAAELVGQGIASAPPRFDLDRADLVEVARHRRLGDREADRPEPRRDLLLAAERLGADQVGDRLLPARRASVMDYPPHRRWGGGPPEGWWRGNCRGFRRRSGCPLPPAAGADGAHGLAPISQASAPRAVCIRFSAWSQTALCGPSITPALTSSPRRAGRQWRKRASGQRAISASSTR